MMDSSISDAINEIAKMDSDSAIAAINEIKLALHAVSPMRSEPVDCVIWVRADGVFANDYNPNKVAPPEMELLRHSINHDGYTQPVVTWVNDGGVREVIDGFHRTRVAKECDDVRKRVLGYLPAVTIKADCEGRMDRIASTIRHNRARGKHQVDSMSDIVIELKKRNWSDNKIGKELGMDPDEVLRLSQISGIAEVFADTDFSRSWEIGELDDSGMDGELIIDDAMQLDRDTGGRIFHTWEKWECYKAGFYESKPPKGMTEQEALDAYRELLADIDRFGHVLGRVIKEWKYSCEHYLTNENMNRIAWLGQASLCYELGIPSAYRGGYNLLSDAQKLNADMKALEYLNIWLENNGRDAVTLEGARSSKNVELY